MKLGVSELKQDHTQSDLRSKFLSRFRPYSEKTVRVLWATLCVLLASVALFNFHQTQTIQEDMVKRRLIEVSLQDLVIQSTALRHLDDLHSYETKLGLDSRGYSSPQELANQLAARLAVIEAINNHPGLLERTNVLRQRLIQIDALSNSSRQGKTGVIDEWFVDLSLLNTAVKESGVISDSKLNTLQRNNIVLTLIVLFFSLGHISWTLWLRSQLRLKFADELLQANRQTRTDPLTGLLNRRGWLEMSENYLQEMQCQNNIVGSMAIVDIDYFKQYNDTYGHDAGDVRLCEFAETLKANFRPGDFIARIGVEEFAVLLPNCTAQETQRIVDRIRLGNHTQLGFSAGICDISLSEGIERTMANADQALYQAKNRGKNRSCLATQD